ncbi:CHC2 zinc finger [Caloramator quimbayensis]|uniref:CHC2 zinc finger n=1 Tax=Caloramator quimbayensis TaxID=1147123 RepID=A0A1T4YDM9_9CLOT|nr:CHC2 zinc finger domain-containing protein [Caloramator quimbayensis]SKA99932.1 CHC2 zinc finger [Caloramator quimbayensis]
MNTKTFLNKIFNNEKINFRALKDGERPINLNGYYNNNMINELKQLNEQGYNIYFVVNSGGTKKEQINKINAFYIDCDCGRDDKDNYFDFKTVKQYKDKILQRVQEFELMPSFIIDTRNGYHIYWLIDNAKVEQFEEVQNKLIQYFNSDERVYTLERIMRLPDYYWTKDINNQYLCKVLQYNDIRYNADDFIQHLNKKVPNFVLEEKNISTKTNVLKQYSIDEMNEHIDAIHRLDIDKMKRLLCNKFEKKMPSNVDISRVEGMGVKNKNNKKDNNIYLTYCSTFYPTPLKASCRADLKHIIYTKISINDFLGVGEGMFNCIIHKDSNPSAHIITLKDGTQVYKCFGCGFMGTITTLVEAIAKCNKVEALEFIQKVYDIEVIETEKQKKIKEMLKENIEYIMSSQFEQEYPELYKVVKRYIPYLVCLNELAIQNVIDDDLISDDKAIFFSSIRYIADYLNSNNIGLTNNRINLFAFLGFLEKLSKEDIPNKYLQRTEAYKKEKYLISYYAVPSYNYYCLKDANTKAKLYKEKNMTMTGFSREMLIRSLNQDEANKVYVQQQNEKLSKASQQFTEKATKIIIDLIQQQGYCTEEQILKQIRGRKEEKKTKLKRCLQEILESYNLKRVKANNELKQKLGITSKGYPFLILNETEE